MNNANQCPQCMNYIIGTYCCTCKNDISNLNTGMPEFFKDIFKDKKDE